MALPSAAAAQPCPATVTHMSVAQGSYSPAGGATFDLKDFSAEMISRSKAKPLCFARKTKITHGEVFVSSESLTKLFTQKISKSDSKIKDVKVETRDDRSAKISGTMHKGIDMPFEIEGPISTDGTNLILQAKKIKAEKLPIKGLLDMMGKNLGEMLGSESMSGVEAKGDTLIFKPAQISSAEGHIEKLDVTSKGLQVTFGPTKGKTVSGSK